MGGYRQGYQHQPSEYVALTDEDFRLRTLRPRGRSIAAFVDPPRLPACETPYYLSPARRQQVYALFGTY
jgi:non-homologous end joining protein Ku